MEHQVATSIDTTESVLFDAVYIPGGKKSVNQLINHAKFIKFVNEAFKHCKTIAVDGEAEEVLDHTFVAEHKQDEAILINAKPDEFVEAIAKHRNWKRMEITKSIPV
jgi:catalase